MKTTVKLRGYLYTCWPELATNGDGGAMGGKDFKNFMVTPERTDLNHGSS